MEPGELSWWKGHGTFVSLKAARMSGSKTSPLSVNWACGFLMSDGNWESVQPKSVRVTSVSLAEDLSLGDARVGQELWKVEKSWEVIARGSRCGSTRGWILRARVWGAWILFLGTWAEETGIGIASHAIVTYGSSGVRTPSMLPTSTVKNLIGARMTSTQPSK